jgi:hypothetical protein
LEFKNPLWLFQRGFLCGDGGQLTLALSLDALGAGPDSSVLNLEPLEVGVKPDFGGAHGVASSRGILIAFAADLTFSHNIRRNWSNLLLLLNLNRLDTI